VTISVGGDGRQVAVPNVLGLALGDARAALAAVGLGVAVAQGPDAVDATVATQDPGAAARLVQGEAVSLTTQVPLQGAPRTVGGVRRASPAR
jgi:beta-lactam-binding protein with PASTA domain